MISREFKKIGILGGMGPEATADIYLKLINLFRNRYACDENCYPHVIINSLPMPNFFQRRSIETRNYIVNEILKLQQCGAEVIAMACNSAHFYFSDILESIAHDTLLIDLIDEVVMKTKQDGFKKIGILSTKIAKTLYDRKCRENGIKSVLISEESQTLIEFGIVSLLSERTNNDIKSSLVQLGNGLEKNGAECILLGCTDLSYYLEKEQFNIPVFASNKILAQAIFEKAIVIQ